MESLNLSVFPEIKIPKFVKVKQIFNPERIEDIPQEVRREVQPLLQGLKGKSIAVGVGSRGITNIKQITKAVIDELLDAGAKPFIIPTMGSHGGAVAAGQAELLASYGITPESMGVPIDPSMEVEEIGELEPGLPIFVAKSAFQADGIVVIARVKAHTAFRGPIESGVAKMLTIGLGKQIGADSLHHQGFGRFAEIIPKAARLVVEKTKVLFALALVENAYEDTYKIEALSRDEIFSMEKEMGLLEESKERMGRILFPEFDVLVIEEIGKNISGDGQDPNVTGLYITPYASDGPKFQKSVIFDLTEESHGNANGMGSADLITRKLFDQIDFVKTYTNSFTSTEVLPVKIPMVASSKEDALRIAIKMCNRVEEGQHRIVWIKNTLELKEIIISEPLFKTVQENSQIQVLSEPQTLTFIDGEPIFNG